MTPEQAAERIVTQIVATVGSVSAEGVRIVWPSPAEHGAAAAIIREAIDEAIDEATAERVTLLDTAWKYAPKVGGGTHPGSGEMLHETRRIYITRIYQGGKIVKQFAETPAIGESKVGYDERLEQ